MAIYYVKNDGSNAADGLSDANAWQTIAKVNGSSFSAGDSILFERGGTWRETLTVPSDDVTVGAYGAGVRPIISGADVITGWATYENFTDGTGSVPVSWWMFEDAASPSLDESANNNDLNWAASAARSATHVQGSYSISTPTNADQLSRSFANLSSNWPFKAATTAFTYGGWVYLKGNMATNRLLTFQTDNSTMGWKITGAAVTGKFRFRIYTNAGLRTIDQNTAAFTTDGWHHVMVRWNGTNVTGAGAEDELSLWVDGVKQSTTYADTSVVLVTSGSFYFYGAADGGLKYDEWAMFDVPLLDTQIASIYNVGLAADRAPANGYKVAATTEPTMVFVDGVRATKGASLAALANGEWWWASNVLTYRSDSGNPDTLGLAIEAAQRDYCVDSNSKTGLTLDGLTCKRSKLKNFGGVYIHGVGKVDDWAVNDCLLTENYGSGCFIGHNSAGGTFTNNTATYNGFHGMGFAGSGSETNQTITGNDIHDNGWVVDGTFNYPCGVFGNISSGEIADNDIHDNGAGGGASHAHGIYVNGNPTAGTLTVHDNLLYNHSKGYGAKLTSSCTANDNDIHDNFSGGLTLDTSQDANNAVITCHHNRIYDNVADATGDAGVGIIKGAGTLTVNGYHNALYHNGPGTGELYVGNDITVLDWRNNIHVTNGTRYIRAVAQTGTVTVDYNRYYGSSDGPTPFVYDGSQISLATWREQAFTPDANSSVADPLFTNAAGGNFTLQAGSPCINAGVDIEGISGEYSGSAPDIGAYEVSVSSSYAVRRFRRGRRRLLP